MAEDPDMGIVLSLKEADKARHGGTSLQLSYSEDKGGIVLGTGHSHL
jgi:hypothetical protein